VTSDWVVLERDVHDWIVVDSASTMSYELSQALGERLWTRDDLWSLPFPQASELCQSSSAPDMASFDVEVLGARLRLQSQEPATFDYIRRDTQAALAPFRRSADVVVRFDSMQAWQSAHRAVPSRSGVLVRERGASTWSEGAHALPVFPPLQSPPLAQRFLALHGALLVDAEGTGLIVCGDQGVGKTSAVLWAAEAMQASVATDEIVMLDVLTGAVYGVPIAVATRTDGRRSRTPLGEREVFHSGAAAVANVVILERRSRDVGFCEQAGTFTESMLRLEPHVRYGGASPTASASALKRFTATTKVWVLGVSDWPCLTPTLASGLGPLLAAPRSVLED
jgi:hypothetical protein